VGVVEAYRDLPRSPTFASSADLLRYATTLGRGVVEPFQLESEILSLLERVRAAQPKVVLEIGTANGGTLLLFARSAHPSATIVSVDLPGEAPGTGYAPWRIPVYRRFALPAQTLHLVRGDSHDQRTRARVEALLGGAQVDFLFIDGDHSYDGVKADFEDYRDLVKAGGLIALHDISWSDRDAYAVRRFWNELRPRYEHEEFVATPPRGKGGIGLLRLPEREPGGGA
jgi:predicted O-methyltransferase YrrM